MKTEKKLTVQNELRKIYVAFLMNSPNSIANLNKGRSTFFNRIEELKHEINDKQQALKALKEELEKRETRMQNLFDPKQTNLPNDAKVLSLQIANVKNDSDQLQKELHRQRAEKKFDENSIVDLEDNYLNKIKEFVIFNGYKQVYSIFRQAIDYFEQERKQYFDEFDSKIESEMKEVYSTNIFELEIESYIDKIVELEMKSLGLQFNSFLVPLSFFLFIYFTGFLITLPLINSVFTQQAQNIVIPILGNGKGIPIVVIQWGFLGGLVYTSISLLNRFLRKDIVPRVYFNSAYRLLFSAVASIIIYFFYSIFSNTESFAPPQLILICFAAGIAPIQILIYYGEYLVSFISKLFKRQSSAGNQNITQMDGIDLVISQRLSEEGIDYVQQLALCDPNDLSSRTKFPIKTVIDWKDQAICYYLTFDITIKNDVQEDHNDTRLNKFLQKQLGIHRMTDLLKILKPLYDLEDISKLTEIDISNRKQSFFKSLSIGGESNFERFDEIFQNIYLSGKRMTV